MIKISEVVGKTASVQLGTNVIAGIRAWAIDMVGDAVEITDFTDSGHRAYLAGLDSWSGSFEGFGQPGWSTSAAIGSTYMGSFYVSSATSDCYSGSIIITGVSPSVAVDGVAMVAYTFQGTKALGFG